MEKGDGTLINQAKTLKEFWLQDGAETRVGAPVELTLYELEAVAGGPEVEAGSSS